jgi:hypothetical protein
MRLPKRRTFWFAAAVLVVGVGIWFCAPRSRITYENFSRIETNATMEDVKAILGDHCQVRQLYKSEERGTFETTTMEGTDLEWRDGPSFINIAFETVTTKGVKLEWHNGPKVSEFQSKNDHIIFRRMHLAGTWETRTWYAKKGAEKIGVK